MGEERIPVSGTYNFRDVGGYPTAGGRIRRGVLYRSDGLHRLDDAGRAALAERDVRTVIDLRDEYETAVMPDALGDLDVSVSNLPVFEGSGASQASGPVALDSLYQRIVTQHAGVVVQALREVADARTGAVLVHCTAGKDRTGIVIALALLAVGVPRQVVLDDYAASAANLAGEWLDGMIEMAARYNVPDTPELRVLMGGSPPEALAATIDLIDGRYGSVREYLLAAGLSLGELAALENRLVERD